MQQVHPRIDPPPNNGSKETGILRIVSSVYARNRVVCDKRGRLSQQNFELPGGRKGFAQSSTETILGEFFD